MSEQTILFLHGFASSAQSKKARYLGERLEDLPQVGFHALDLNPTPADFYRMTASGLINRLRQYVLDHDLEQMDLIGSSYGGFIALHYAHRFGGVGRMLLLAPSLRGLSGRLSEAELEEWRRLGALPVHHYAFGREVSLGYDFHLDELRYLEFAPPPAPVLIIHGRNDQTVSVQDSRHYAASYPERVRLVEVDADHDLNGHLDLIWDAVGAFLMRPGQGEE